MRCINCNNEFENEYCNHCGLSRKYNKVLYRYYERHPEQENQAVRHSSSIKCINCGMVFEHDNCPRCGLSYKNSRVLYRYEERQRENYHPQKKSKKRKKPVYKRWWFWLATPFAALVLLAGLVGIFGDKNIYNTWTEADFSFYDDNNAEKVFLTNDNPYITLSEHPELQTLKTVRVGDEAVDALAKYQIPYDLAAFGALDAESPSAYTHDIDMGKEILRAAQEEKTLAVSIVFDSDFKPVDAVNTMRSMPNAPKGFAEGYYWMAGFVISDEKISDVYFSRWYLSANPDETNVSKIEPVSSSMPNISREDIISRATSATYQDLLRDPSSHKGEYIVLTVKLQQVLDDSGFLSSETYYFGYTDNSGYDLYFDDQYCFTDTRVDDSTKLLKDDILTVYGVFSGTGDFKRALGGTTVEIPMVEMLYVDIGAQDDASKITKSEFDSIENGMTYDEVVEIIGGEGELISEVDLGEYKVEMYSWQGEGSIGANAIIQFQDGKMETKTQAGLE